MVSFILIVAAWIVILSACGGMCIVPMLVVMLLPSIFTYTKESKLAVRLAVLPVYGVYCRCSGGAFPLA